MTLQEVSEFAQLVGWFAFGGAACGVIAGSLLLDLLYFIAAKLPRRAPVGSA